MTTVLAFLLAIALLVVIHELGHYGVARLCGVKVLRFSVGFGTPLYTRRFGNGETEWLISAVPIGGYVKMLDEREGEVKPHELDRAFNRKPVLQRMAIVVAGPAANLILAILLYWVLFMQGVPGLKPVLGEVVAHSPADVAQMEIQETIISINGQTIASWDEVRWTLMDIVMNQGDCRIEARSRDGVVRQHVLDLAALAPGDLDGEFLQKIGLQPYQPVVLPVVGALTADGVAQRAGLMEGDRILSVAGRPLARWMDFVEVVRNSPGQAITLEIERAGHAVTVQMTPEPVIEAGKEVGKIGAAPKIDRQAYDELMTEVRYPPVAGLGQALRKTWETSWLSLKLLGKMLQGEMSLSNLSGPLTIADYAGQSAQMGMAAYLGFLALISISLGVLNLLPIPLLDGGHLLYYGVEIIKGSPVSDRALEIGQSIGMALLATLMIVALYNDISRLFSG